MAKQNYTYILRCADGTLYCGWTNDLNRRLAAHNAGTAAKYTRSRRPVALAYCEAFESKQEAMSREAQIKRLSRQEKLALISERGVGRADEPDALSRFGLDAPQFDNDKEVPHYDPQGK